MGLMVTRRVVLRRSLRRRGSARPNSTSWDGWVERSFVQDAVFRGLWCRSTCRRCSCSLPVPPPSQRWAKEWGTTQQRSAPAERSLAQHGISGARPRTVNRIVTAAVVRAVNGTEGRYRVESSPLAGTRRVFPATRVFDQARFVIKRPRVGYPLAQEGAVLRHEFSVLSRLKGTPVSEAHEFIEGPDAALVLAVAKGRSLSELIAEGLPDATRFVSWAVEMTRTLAAVHARGFVHRDLKPLHFFVDDEARQVTLIDFGLAIHLIRERRLPVEPDEIQGTLGYISPEQTGRTNRSVDHRSDLYSLGVTFYELWTRKRPFESEDALQLIHAHIARTPNPPRQHRPNLPAVLEEIVLRLLAKSPEDRYQTATGLLADLERARTELASSGQITPFSLGQLDYDGTLRVPEKLYGRAAPLKTLLELVSAAQSGARTLALISGPPG